MVIAGLVGSVLGGIFLDKFHKFKRGFDSDLSKIIMMKILQNFFTEKSFILSF